ncbi:hypothetical protein [Geobacter sp. SVR]|uniref:hypothetical protein n=1 Tax=Geobacter sp. SVR TaxID=2495594 RepID=UPI00143F02A4|nr:hypothetical protein [Geobacter sp. SVR]BCS54085.1 hypothetical protein GSVR_23930 [Geobacter sp. SVR]GCF87568.1 hypothetical protein GSbR_41680 [Geobacter sp. SVR]
MFRFKGIVDKDERTFGFMTRFLGIDFAVMVFGWLNDWSVIELKIPCNYGILCHVGPIVVNVGRFQNGIYEETQKADVLDVH